MTTHMLKVSRLEGLTDGIFAIAMTIMVLNLHVPTNLSDDKISPLIHGEAYTNLFIYAGSFIILGTHWIAMNFQFGLLEKLNRVYLWTTIYYLMTICIVPFSANLLGAYRYNIHSIHFYAMNLLFACLGQFLTLQCGHYFKLYKNFYRFEIYRATLLRILVAPIFYISAIALAHWSTRAAFIVLIAPTLIYIIPGRIDRFESQ